MAAVAVLGQRRGTKACPQTTGIVWHTQLEFDEHNGLTERVVQVRGKWEATDLFI